MTEITEDPKALINIARKFYSKGDLESVACVYKNVLLLDPNNEEAKRSLEKLLGIYYLNKGRGHVGCILGAYWSFDGKYIFSYGTDNFVGIWSYKLRRIVRLLDTGGSKISVLSVHPKEYRFAIGTYSGDILIYDAFSCQKTILTAHEAPIVNITWTPEGKKFVSSDTKGNIFLWDDKTKKLKLRMESYGEKIDVFKWSVGGRYLLGYSFKGKVNIWNPRTGRILYKLNLGSRLYSCDWSPRSESIVIGTSEGYVMIYELRHNKSFVVGTHDHIVSHVFWTKDNRIISVGWDRKIRVWDAYDMNILKEIETLDLPIILARLSKSEKYLALSYIRHAVEVVNLFEGTKYKFDLKDGLISSLQWRPASNALAVSTANRKIYIIDLDSQKILCQLHEESLRITCILFIPDKNLFILGLSDGSLALFDTKSRKITFKKKIHNCPIVCMAPNRDYSKLAAIFKDGTVRILSIDNLEEKCSIVFPPPGMKTISYNPTKEEILIGHNDGYVTILDDNCRIISRIKAHDQAVSAVCWNKNGNKFISASVSGELKLWDRDTLQGTFVISIGEPITCLDWNRKVNYVAIGTSEGRVVIINLDTNEIYTEFKLHRGTVNSVRWSIDGIRLSSCGSDGKLVVYQIVRKNYRICPIGSPTCDSCWGTKGKELYCGCMNGDLAVVKINI